MTVVNAGHPAPLLLSGDGARQLEVEPPRPPLGLGGRSGTLTTSIAPRDRLLLYTDGLTEARDPSTRAFLPAQQIVAALQARDTVGDAVSGLRDDVLRWSGGALHDDIALVLLEYQPAAAAPERAGAGRGAASSLG